MTRKVRACLEGGASGKELNNKTKVKKGRQKVPRCAFPYVVSFFHYG